ncbi:MAG TPA: tRNA epoxyqueuosine(34) reductase QueG [Terriglobales bacterium]|nr:tRNA epoxyqueuosine(34) reductase QueG [Terriglobales bacterium]
MSASVQSRPGFTEVARQAALDAGFELFGITPVRGQDFKELEYFPQWIEAGRAGEMEYLKSRNEAGELKRASLHNVAPWAKSVIVCGLNYNSDETRSDDPHDPTAGWISRYAWFQQSEAKGGDYHEAVLRRLREVEAKLSHDGELRSWCYVDTGPLVERVYAKYAGLGWMGKNTCIINEEMGSFFFLGVILTSFEFGDDMTPPMPAADRCGSCTRCIDACPTQALAPYQLDAARCISYLTIEKRGALPEEFRAAMGRHVFGCDICQDVCPWNGAKDATRRAPLAKAAEFQPRRELVNPALEWLAAMSKDDFNRVFKNSPIKRAKYQGFRRNVAIALGNSCEKSARPGLERMAADDDPVVAEHARWGLGRLDP